MRTIRFQDMTPEVYTDESRDFQILCRLHDSIWNGVKFDAETIKYIIDSRNIQSGLLPLLQTKLGFLTDKRLNDNEIRYVLRVFPDLLRNKGSLLAIRKLLNMCLKLNDISGEFTISYSDKPTIINGISINAHTIIVGIDTIIKNTEMINEIAKYILPAGFSFYIYFYKNYRATDNIYLNDDVKLLYSSSNLNSQIRGTRDNSDEFIDYTMPLSTEPMSYDLLGGVDVAYINSIDSKISENFKGIFNSTSDFPVGSNGNYAITFNTVNNVVYPIVYYYNDSWNELNFRGYCELSHSNPQVSNPQSYDVVSSPQEDKYLVYSSSSWITCNYRGLFLNTSSVTNPQTNDLIALTSGHTNYYIYKNGSWNQVEYKATYLNNTQIDDTYKIDNNLVILTGSTYFMYVNNSWTIITDSIYMLKKYITENNIVGEQ